MITIIVSRNRSLSENGFLSVFLSINKILTTSFKKYYEIFMREMKEATHKNLESW